MAAFKLNLQIDQGATYEKVVTWKTGATPSPVNLTGCTARMHIREKAASTVVLLELTTENGGIALGGVDGTVTLHITAAQTAAMTWRTGVYDVEIVFSGGIVRRLIAGSVTVSQEVTRG